MADVYDIVLLTLKVGFVGVLGALPFALLFGYILARWDFWGKAILSAIIMLPLVMPPVVTGLILLDLFGPNGILGQFFAQFGIIFAFRWTGAALAAGLVALPLMVRPIRQGFEAVDDELYEALSVMGQGRWKIFILLDLPTALPAILAGIILGFAKALGEFGATITFVASIPNETQTLSLAVFSALQQPDSALKVLILVSLSIALSVISVVGSELLVQKISDKIKGRGK
ncbi:MAG: molybdate ABC transporter permease subunit [Devosiaceae bacterium]|nr:molybdate ABC transporter permease subunit [Devosiaceae bacterium]